MPKLHYLILAIFFVGCGAFKKKTTYSDSKSFGKTRTVTVEASKPRTLEAVGPIEPEVLDDTSSLANNIINTALTFSGTRYKFGGTTKKGMDCSGLLHVAFGEHDVKLPRVSYDMAEEGRPIKIKNVTKGDLLFFITSKRSRHINHVGMVVAIENKEIKFIHASTSRGVIVSSLHEGFWNSAFVKATRVL